MQFSFHSLINFFLNSFSDSSVSYYNLDVLSNNANVFLFYILFSILFLLAGFFIFKKPYILKLLYRRYCRFSYFAIRFLYNSFFFSYFLHMVMLFFSRFYFFLYGRGNNIALSLPEVRKFSVDPCFVDIFFAGHHLFSVQRVFFLSVLRDAESFLSDVFPDGQHRVLGFGRPFFDDILDKISASSAISQLIRDYSSDNRCTSFKMVDYSNSGDTRLVSFFDFSCYFETKDDLLLFLFLLDFLSFNYHNNFNRDLDPHDFLNLFRKSLIPICYGSFFRYVLYCYLHYFSFFSRDFFLLFLFSFMGVVFHYFFFMIGLLVIVFLLTYDFTWHFSLVFILPLLLGFFGLFLSTLFILILLMFRITTSFFYISPFWIDIIHA